MRALVGMVFGVAILAGLGWVGWSVYERVQEEDAAPKAAVKRKKVAPVEVAAIRVGRIDRTRTVTGTLEPRSTLVVAPKIQGRVRELRFDVSQRVRPNQIVAVLDDAEHRQVLAQAEAEVKVAAAKLEEAENAVAIAQRGLDRVTALRKRGVASESQLDVAQAEFLAKQSAVVVAQAQLSREQAVRSAAAIRLGYTEIRARWDEREPGADEPRVVAARHVEQGGVVAANQPLLTIVEVAPILGVVHVGERDYPKLAVGDSVAVTVDAFPGDPFTAKIERIAPTFRRETRQARIELSLANEDGRLKPGMFLRATFVLARIEDATLAPSAALTKRDDVEGAFFVGPDGKTAIWRPLRIGIRTHKLVQLLDEDATGRVVTLGQQLLDDGSVIAVSDRSASVPAEPAR